MEASNDLRDLPWQSKSETSGHIRYIFLTVRALLHNFQVISTPLTIHQALLCQWLKSRERLCLHSLSIFHSGSDSWIWSSVGATILNFVRFHYYSSDILTRWEDEIGPSSRSTAGKVGTFGGWDRGGPTTVRPQILRGNKGDWNIVRHELILIPATARLGRRMKFMVMSRSGDYALIRHWCTSSVPKSFLWTPHGLVDPTSISKDSLWTSHEILKDWQGLLWTPQRLHAYSYGIPLLLKSFSDRPQFSLWLRLIRVMFLLENFSIESKTEAEVFLILIWIISDGGSNSVGLSGNLISEVSN